ncbi:hypothetical protein SUDANB105_07711 [Streptomyces sp. enrichment culture]
MPGQHPSHYAPRARVVLVESEKVVREAELAQELGHQVGVILPPSFADARVKAHAVVAVPGSMAACACGLYGFLRELDQQGCDLIVTSLPVEEGLGLAIANRLLRAAGPSPVRSCTPTPATTAGRTDHLITGKRGDSRRICMGTSLASMLW